MQMVSVFRMNLPLALATVSTALLGTGWSISAKASAAVAFNIPSEDMGQALLAFGTAVKAPVFYSYDVVAGLYSTEVKGVHTPGVAMRILLEGSNLQVEKTSTGAFLIHSGANAHASKVEFVAHPSDDIMENGGKPGLADTLHLAQASQSVPTSYATVDNAREQTPEKGSPGLDEIVVTGTSIGSSDSAASQGRPVDVVTARTIENAGVANLEDFFHTQPTFVLSGQSSYTNGGGSSAGDGTSFGASTLNLRGLGPQYTLVLLNGRRFQAEDPANIDAIPVDAIERVELLKSGASAVYGSDAVAGVVNIITKRTADGFNFTGYYGQSGQSDDQTRRFSASWGTSSDNWSLFVVGEYYSRAGLTQGQRSLSANPDLSRFNSGFDYQVFPYSSLAQTVLPGGTGPLVLNQSTFGCGSYSRNAADYVPLNSHLYATSCDAKLDEDKRSLINPQRKGTFFASLDYDVSDKLAIYADFDFARSLTESVGLLYGADGYGDPNSPLNFTIPASNFWNPFGVPITAVTYGFPEASPQVNDVDTSEGRLNLGIKGALGIVHYDIGGSYFYDYANDVKGPYPVSAGLYAAENRPGAESVNLFCNACNTAAQLDGIFANTNVQNWEEAALFNAHAYAPVFTLPAGDINVAAGAEYQRDTYIVQPAPALANGTFYDVIEPPVSAGRRYTSVYVESQLPIFGKAMSVPGIYSLGVDVAARYENIEQAGSRTDPTVSLHWAPVENWLTVRGSYGTSFRAPSLTAVHAPVVTYGADPLINPATGKYANYEVVEGGNSSLKPETSTYTGYGLVLTPQFAPGLTLQLDRWIINQKNIVIQTSPQLVLDGVQPGGTFTAVDGTTGVYSLYKNAAGQRVNGTDLDLDYQLRTDSAGSFDFRLSGTYFLLHTS